MTRHRPDFTTFGSLTLAVVASLALTACAPSELKKPDADGTGKATTESQTSPDKTTSATQTRDRDTTGITQFPAQAAPADWKLPFPDALAATDMKETGRKGGSLTFAVIGEPKTFDPITANENSSTQVIGFLFSSLLGYDLDRQEYYPSLLKSLTVAEDNKTWTATLRDGLEWSDGHPLTADDIIFTSQIIYDPNIINPSADIMQVAGKPLTFEKIDNLNVKITAAEPTGFIHIMLAGLTPLPRHTLEESYKSGQFNTALSVNIDPAKLVVSGPFKLQVYQQGERVVLVRNDKFFRVDKSGSRLPYLDSVVFSVAPDLDSMTAKFRSGNADVLDSPRPEIIPDLRAAQEKENFRLYDSGPGNSTSFFWFNLKTGNSPEGKPYLKPELQETFGNLEFRKAVYHSINRDNMIKTVLRGLAVNADSLTPEALKDWHNPNLPQYEYNLDKARGLLDKAGFKDINNDGMRETPSGKPLDFTFITNVENKTRTELSTIISTDLREIGIKATPQSVDFNTLVTQLNDTFQYEACLLGFTGSMHPINSMNMWRSSGRTHTWNPLQKTPGTPWEAEIDRLADSFTQALDFDSQQKTIFRMQQILAEQIPILPLYTPKQFMCIRSNIGNVRPTPFAQGFWNAEELYIN